MDNLLVPENKDLVLKLINGRPESFNRIYVLYYRKMLVFSRSFIKDRIVSEDIVQEAFLSLWEKRSTLAENTHLGAYLLTIVKNKALNVIKQQNTRLKIEDSLYSLNKKEFELNTASLEACNPTYIFSQEVQKIVKDSLDLLSNEARRIMILSRFDNKTNSEIADIMGISLKGVEYHITKALKVLQNKLRDYTGCLSVFFLL